MVEGKGKIAVEEVVPCLCMVLGQKIVGMDLGKLWQVKVEEVVDPKHQFSDLSGQFSVMDARLGMMDEVPRRMDPVKLFSDPFDFSLDLGDTNIPLGMRHFVLDSNIYMAGGFTPDQDAKYRSSASPNPPCYRIYEFHFDNNNNKPLLSVTDSIPEPPGPLAESWVANISGDIYFLKEHPLRQTREEDNFFFLDSRLKQWKRLPPPPPFGFHSRDGFCSYAEFFVLHNKLFLQCYVDAKRDSPIYSFDPQTASWTQEDYEDNDNHFLNSFRLKIDDELQYCFPQITLSDLPGFSNNSSIMLASTYVQAYKHLRMSFVERLSLRVRIYAFLVNQKGVLLYQPLEECFEGIQPTFYTPPECFLMDLGNNMACALIYGYAREHDKGLVLCISVFTLAKDKLHTDANTDAAPMEQRFLSVCILGERVFRLNNKEDKPLLEAFICRTKKNTKMSKKRKELPH